MKFKFPCLFVLLLLPFTIARAQSRSVIDKEVGSVFDIPDGFPYADFGAFVGSASAGSLDPDALCVVYARFDKFSTSDNTIVRGFPYSALRTYESQQVAAGKPPIFITATYLGKKRPVYFSWSLKLVNGVPSASSSKWEYAVNVQDSRYVDFWINRYVRPILWTPFYSVKNVWFELDESAFNWNLLGVLDDNNHFVAGVPWDSPFPETQSTYLSSVASFFNQLKQLAPDIKVMPNIGSMSDPTQFQTVLAGAPGALMEDIYSWHAAPTTYTRNAWYQQTFLGFSWLAAQNRITILRATLPSGDTNALRTSFVVYSLLKGPNSFFAPATSSSTNPNPSEWLDMKAVLGNPLNAPQSVQKSSTGVGYRLYWRNFTDGAAYLNLSGSAQTILLDSRYKHWDANGNVVTQISIPDASGTYVTTETGVLLAPAISPRSAAPFTDPLLVTITSEISGATIRYTLNNTPPGLTSPIYTGPFELSANAVVQTSAFRKGDDPSFPSIATYTVHPSLPTVQFATSSHSGPAGTYYPVLSLSAVPLEIVTVHYSVRAPTGTVTTGSVSFLPGTVYRYFPVTISGAAGTESTITITSATGASVGTTHTLMATVQ